MNIKSDTQYCQVTEYEILNTEIRTQLFMHLYGYIQANVDFGNVWRYLKQGEVRRVNYLSLFGSEEYMRDALNVNIKAPAEINDFKGLNQLVYRQFCIIWVRPQLSADFHLHGPVSRSVKDDRSLPETIVGERDRH